MSYPAPINLIATLGSPPPFTCDLTWSVPPSPCSLLLHFDTDFSDSSGNNNTPFSSGAAVISPSVYEFGGGSLSLPSANTSAGTSVSYAVAANGPLDLFSTSGDFTIEFWTQSSGNYANAWLMFFLDSSNNIVFYVQMNPQVSSATVFGAGSAPTHWMPPAPNTWVYIAITRAAGVLNLFLNGVLSVTIPFGAVPATPAILQFGLPPPSTTGGCDPCYIDEVRITKGVAIYTANYTPPTAPFTGGPPLNIPGYDLYRNGASIAAFIGPPGYVDTVPGYGTYQYQVAAWTTGGDQSPLSNIATFTTAPAPIPGVGLSPAIMVANPGSINPRIYPPERDTTYRIKPNA